MTSKIKPVKMLKKGVKLYDIRIFDENNNLVEVLEHTGKHVGAKKKAEAKIKELSTVEVAA